MLCFKHFETSSILYVILKINLHKTILNCIICIFVKPKLTSRFHRSYHYIYRLIWVVTFSTYIVSLYDLFKFYTNKKINTKTTRSENNFEVNGCFFSLITVSTYIKHERSID